MLFITSDIEEKKYSYNLVWVSFQTNELRIFHLIIKKVDMVQQQLIRGWPLHSLSGAKIGYLYFSD